MTTLADTYEAVGNACLQVHDDGGEVTFLYKVLPGGSGVRATGSMSPDWQGFPRRWWHRLGGSADGVGTGPLPNAEATGHSPCPRGNAPTLHPIEARLRGIDPLHTAPFAALQLLHELRELVIQGASMDQPHASGTPMRIHILPPPPPAADRRRGGSSSAQRVW